MTLSGAKFHRRTAPLLLALGLAGAPFAGAFAADPPEAQLAAAGAAVAAAQRAQPSDTDIPAMAEAEARLAQARDAAGRRKYRDAARLADEAQAAAELALASAKLANARSELEEKRARNAELQRQLQVVPEPQR